MRRARESMFGGSQAGSLAGDDDEYEPPELAEGENPFPEELLKGVGAGGGGKRPPKGGKRKAKKVHSLS